MAKGISGEDITGLFKKRLPFIDLDAIYRELVEMKRLMPPLRSVEPCLIFVMGSKNLVIFIRN